MMAIKFTFPIVLVLSIQCVFSQWKITGNAAAGSEKLGTTNNFPLNIITNNAQRMSITASGKIGIGTAAPEAKLHILNGSAGTVAALKNSTLVTENAGDNYISVLTPADRESGILFGNTSSPLAGGIFYNNTVNPRGVIIRANNGVSHVSLTDKGFFGVGTITPLAELHVIRGNQSFISPNPNATAVVESVSDNFINMLNPGNHTSGILFGNLGNVQDGGMIYNSVETIRGMQFNTNGNTTRMVITSAGAVGIGTKSPGTELQVSHANSFDGNHGLRLQNIQSNTNWTLYVDGASDLNLFFNNKFLGFFDNASGAYISTSDARRKKDIEAAPDVLSKVMDLGVKKYHFTGNKSDDKKYYGMIAQDVEKVFPEAVFHKTLEGAENDVYMMNYSAFGVIAIKAIQEQEAIIDKQKSTIQQQQTAIEELLADVEAIKDQLKTFSTNTHSSNTNTAMNSSPAHLSQNTPNPFNANTTISYYVPEIKGNVSIEIVSSTGQLIRTYPVTQKGNGQITIKRGDFAAGAYYYVLKVNGVKVHTRQMILTK